jgi:hypothetical protein
MKSNHNNRLNVIASLKVLKICNNIFKGGLDLNDSMFDKYFESDFHSSTEKEIEKKVAASFFLAIMRNNKIPYDLKHQFLTPDAVDNLSLKLYEMMQVSKLHFKYINGDLKRDEVIEAVKDRYAARLVTQAKGIGARYLLGVMIEKLAYTNPITSIIAKPLRWLAGNLTKCIPQKIKEEIKQLMSPIKEAISELTPEPVKEAINFVIGKVRGMTQYAGEKVVVGAAELVLNIIDNKDEVSRKVKDTYHKITERVVDFGTRTVENVNSFIRNVTSKVEKVKGWGDTIVSKIKTKVKEAPVVKKAVKFFAGVKSFFGF